MTSQDFLLQQWNKCIWLVHDDWPSIIFLVYDKHHQRKMKFNSLNYIKEEIEFIQTNDSEILFVQDYYNGYLCFNHNFIGKYKKYDIFELLSNVKELDEYNSTGIKSFLENLMKYKPPIYVNVSEEIYREYGKLKQLMPSRGIQFNNGILSNSNELTQIL